MIVTKKSSVIIFTLALAVVFSLPASASAAINSGIKPGRFFYFFDTAFEKVGLFFTFNPEKKARKALEYADERLAEAEAVAEDNNAEAVKTAIINYESNIAFAAEKSKYIVDKEKAAALLTIITDSASRHQEVLMDVLAKVPDEAKEVITNTIEASRKGKEEALQKIAELKGEIERLKQEVAELKAKDEEREKVIEELSKQKTESLATPQKISAPQIPVMPIKKPEIVQPQLLSKTEAPKTTSIVTLPNGAVVEMDVNGNILRYIKEVPKIITQSQSTPATPPPATAIIQAETLEITSIDVSPIDTFVRMKWQTNKPTSAKVFISGGGLSSKIFNSESVISTTHLVSISGLKANTIYSYEIEAISGDNNFAKKTGEFNTLLLFPPPVFISGPTAVIAAGQNQYTGVYLWDKIDWATDKPTTIIWPTNSQSYHSLCSPSHGILEPRTTYQCTLKVQDTIGNTVEKTFFFTTGPGALKFDGLRGISNSEPAIIKLNSITLEIKHNFYTFQPQHSTTISLVLYQQNDDGGYSFVVSAPITLTIFERKINGPFEREVLSIVVPLNLEIPAANPTSEIKINFYNSFSGFVQGLISSGSHFEATVISIDTEPIINFNKGTKLFSQGY